MEQADGTMAILVGDAEDLVSDASSGVTFSGNALTEADTGYACIESKDMTAVVIPATPQQQADASAENLVPDAQEPVASDAASSYSDSVDRTMADLSNKAYMKLIVEPNLPTAVVGGRADGGGGGNGRLKSAMDYEVSSRYKGVQELDAQVSNTILFGASNNSAAEESGGGGSCGVWSGVNYSIGDGDGGWSKDGGKDGVKVWQTVLEQKSQYDVWKLRMGKRNCNGGRHCIRCSKVGHRYPWSCPYRKK